MLGNLSVFRFSHIRILCALTATSVFLSACSNTDSTSEPFIPDDDGFFNIPLAALALKKEQDCASFKDYVVNSLVERHTHIPDYPYYSCRNVIDFNSPGGINESTLIDMAAAPGGGEGVVPDGVSQTNNQEAGVNEGDIVKTDTDGNMYILNGNHLIIADGDPPDAMTSKVVNLGARGIHLYLDEDNQRVVVIARSQPPNYIAQPTEVDLAVAPAIWPGPQLDETIAIFFDVVDPRDPKVIKQIYLKGYYQDSRRIDGRLHLITRYSNLPIILERDTEFNRLRTEFYKAVRSARCDDGNSVPTEDVSSNPAVLAARDNLAANIRASYSSVDGSDLLPTAFSSDGTTSTPITYLQCPDVHYPQIKMNYGLQVVTSVNTDGKNLQATAIVNNTWMTYASQTHFYLAQTSRSWWWRWNSSPRSQTAIYKFAISTGKPEYRATGRVAGYVKNQFSFSEFEGALRVASTQDDSIVIDNDSIRIRWQRDLKNRLTVLQDDGSGTMKVSGLVSNIAPGETIRSSRFLGSRGFIVTFRDIDPLFTFDLSDPSDPLLIAELKRPGFSTYIHPYDANHLLTIGRSGGEGGTGVGNNLQLQLFDVTNLADPKMIHDLIPDLPSGYTWSAAEYDHKAFTYYAPANILAIPMRIWPDPSAGIKPFSGIMAYKIRIDSGFKELGGVDHSDLAKLYYCEDPSIKLKDSFVGECTLGGYVEWAAPKRSVIMTRGGNVYLYSISEVGMKASNVYDLPNSLSYILFPQNPYPWWSTRWLNGGGSVANPDVVF